MKVTDRDQDQQRCNFAAKLKMEKPHRKNFRTVDEYFLDLPENSRKKLEKVRKAIRQAVPGAEEKISFNMPSFRYFGVLVYYAAHREHIGFYPADPEIFQWYRKDLEFYDTSKGTIRFPMKRPLPISLIKKIARFRAQGNQNKVLSKKTSKK